MSKLEDCAAFNTLWWLFSLSDIRYYWTLYPISQGRFHGSIGNEPVLKNIAGNKGGCVTQPLSPIAIAKIQVKHLTTCPQARFSYTAQPPDTDFTSLLGDFRLEASTLFSGQRSRVHHLEADAKWRSGALQNNCKIVARPSTMIYCTPWDVHQVPASPSTNPCLDDWDSTIKPYKGT